MKDLYKALGVSPNASRDEILARISNCGSATLAKDAEVVLLDDQKRRIYNRNFKVLREVGRIRQDLRLLNGSAWKNSHSNDFNPPNNRSKRSSGYKRSRHKPAGSNIGWIFIVLGLAIRFWPITLFLVIGACNWFEDNFGDKRKSSSNSSSSYSSPSKPKEYRRADANLVEVKLPQTGGGYVYFANEDLVGGFSVKTKPGDYHYLIKLEDYYTYKKKAEFFIRGGDKFGIEVPAGTYRVKMASGKKWYGMKHLFGSNTSYSKASDSFPVSYGDQWTVELIPQRDGNLKDVPIDPDEF